jgi:hypothetical protein
MRPEDAATCFTGCLNTSIATVIRELPTLVSRFPFALITSLDSCTDVASLLEKGPALAGMKQHFSITETALATTNDGLSEMARRLDALVSR